VGRDSSVGIATRYRLDGSGSSPGGGEIFRTCPDRSWGPPRLLYNGYRVFPGSKAPGAWRWPPTPSSAEVKERVELYIYSPMDLRGFSMVNFTINSIIIIIIVVIVGRDSSVGIATRYRLHGPGSSPGGGEIFRTCPDRSWGPPSLLYNGYRVFPECKAPGAWRWPPTPSSVEIKERVELYIHSPMDLRGLFEGELYH